MRERAPSLEHDVVKEGTAHRAFPVYQRLPEGCVPWPVVGRSFSARTTSP